MDFYMLQLKMSHVKIPIHYILYHVQIPWGGRNFTSQDREFYFNHAHYHYAHQCFLFSSLQICHFQLLNFCLKDMYQVDLNLWNHFARFRYFLIKGFLPLCAALGAFPLLDIVHFVRLDGNKGFRRHNGKSL